MDSNQAKPAANHTITLDNRKKGTVSGVEKVISACDTSIVLLTTLGNVFVTGKAFKISSYSEKDRIFTFEGEIDSVKYQQKKEALLRRMFK